MRVSTFAALLILSSCAAPKREARHARDNNDDERDVIALNDLEEAPTPAAGQPLAAFGYELGVSIDTALDSEANLLVARVYVFNRADRTWLLRLESFDAVALQAKGADETRIARECPPRSGRDVIVVGPGERRPVANFCRAASADVEEVELQAELHFRAVDGGEVHLRSPSFRVARHALPGVSTRHTLNPKN